MTTSLEKAARDLSEFSAMSQQDAVETLRKALDAGIREAHLMGKALGAAGIHLAVKYRRISAMHSEYHRRQKRRKR